MRNNYINKWNRKDYRVAMSLREDIEASLTAEESSATDETSTWTASATKRIMRSKNTKSNQPSQLQKKKIPCAGIELPDAMEESHGIHKLTETRRRATYKSRRRQTKCHPSFLCERSPLLSVNKKFLRSPIHLRRRRLLSLFFFF